jgi:putative chitinase
MILTESQLSQILPNARSQAGIFVGVINTAMAKYDINTRARVAAFIAQLGHESGSLHYVRELGGNQYLSKYDTGALAERLGNTLAQDGDGQLYRGRGLFQITGRDNYRAYSRALFGDERLLKTPELLEQPYYAADSAGWFWTIKRLNVLADDGKFISITRRINGGLNGQVERQTFYDRALMVLP